MATAVHHDIRRFRGETPDEIYYGTGEGVSAELEADRKVAREEQLRANRSGNHDFPDQFGTSPTSVKGHKMT